MCLLFCSAAACLGSGPFGPRPIWAQAQLSLGSFGPGPVWTRARLGAALLGRVGPFALRPIPNPIPILDAYEGGALGAWLGE